MGDHGETRTGFWGTPLPHEFVKLHGSFRGIAAFGTAPGGNGLARPDPKPPCWPSAMA
jgi:hypothetical protein